MKIFKQLLSNSEAENRNLLSNSSLNPKMQLLMKKNVKRNHRSYNNWKARGKPPEGKDNVKKVQKETDAMIVEVKSSYQESIAEKLCTSSTGSKLFWTAINRLIDKKKNCNIPLSFISSFKEKACIFMNILLINVIP